MGIEVKFILGIICLWFILFLIGLFLGWRKKRLWFSIKHGIDSSKWFLILIWVLYFIIVSVSLVPLVVRWIDTLLLSHMEDSPAWFLLSQTPKVYIVTILFISFYVLYKGSKPWFRYGEEEKVWLEEERTNTRRILRRIPLIRRKYEDTT